jgi:hypothetical protein
MRRRPSDCCIAARTRSGSPGGMPRRSAWSVVALVRTKVGSPASAHPSSSLFDASVRYRLLALSLELASVSHEPTDQWQDLRRQEHHAAVQPEASDDVAG